MNKSTMKLKLFGHSANDLFWFILPLILPALLVNYDLSYSQAGGILTIYLLVTALGSFVMGRLSDRISRKMIISWGFVLASSGLIASGFASSLPVFLIIISITAVGVSTFHPVMYALLHEDYPLGKSKVLGIYESFGIGAILLMFLVNGFLLSRIGIRGVMIVTAVPGLVMALMYFRSDTGAAAAAETPIVDMPAREPGMNSRGREGFRLIMFLVSIILRVFSVTAIINFLPTIFVSFFGFEPGRAAYATAFFFAGGISGSLLAGKISERYNSFAVLIAATVFISASVAVLSTELAEWLYLVVVVLLGAFSSSCIINQNLIMTGMGGALGKGEVFGIMMGVMTTTAALSPGILGLVLDNFGFRTAMHIYVVPLILSTAVLVFLLRMEKTTGRILSRAEPGVQPEA